VRIRFEIGEKILLISKYNIAKKIITNIARPISKNKIDSITNKNNRKFVIFFNKLFLAKRNKSKMKIPGNRIVVVRIKKPNKSLYDSGIKDPILS
jgi:hypothetical protein